MSNLAWFSLQIVATLDWDMEMDVDTAFLSGKLNESIYKEQLRVLSF